MLPYTNRLNKGPRNIRIDTVHHVPGFHTIFVVYNAIEFRGAYLDGKSKRIWKIKRDSCIAICEYPI
ncbi:hypothetical protein HI914_05820 [Erysiphe necator]|nr:hypothetical protein HI914_05820 [Erysiphe necator]